MKNLIRHIRQSLSLKLSLGILLLAMPIFVITLGVLFKYSRNLVRQEAVKRATSTLNTTSLRVAGYMKTIEDATNSNAWIIEQNFRPDTLLHFSRLIVMLNNNVGGCSITAAPDAFPEHGRYFSAYSVRLPKQTAQADSLREDSIATVLEAEYDYFSKPWYSMAVERGESCWIDPFDDYTEGTLSAPGVIASYSRPLRNARGSLLGVLSVDLSLSRLSAVITAKEPFPKAYFIMLGTEGQYLLHPDSSRLGKESIFSIADASNHPDVIALGHEMTTGRQGSMTVTVDGEPCLVCYQPVPGSTWSLALVCPQSGILKNYRQLTFFILPFVVIGLLLVLMLCRRIVARFLRPLGSLYRQCRRIAQGRFDEHFPRTIRTDSVGRLQNSFAAMQDAIDRHVGDIRHVNDQTMQRNQELQQARQMALDGIRQKTIFMQNITHQIRTPLNIIMGFAHVLGDNFGTTQDEVRKITSMMSYNAMLLKRMVLMLYDSSDTGLNEEQKCLKNEQVLCNELARECIDVTHGRFPDVTVSFTTDLPDDLHVLTNRTYLLRSLLELLYNAVKFSDRQHVSLLLTKTDARVLFIVQDVGPGIARDDQKQMYVPFSKRDDLSEGLGLGLPLAKRHADTLGGDLSLDADYRQGCRFIFEVPL